MKQSKIQHENLPALKLDLTHLEIQMLIKLLEESPIIPEYPKKLKEFHRQILLDLKCFIIAEQQIADELNNWQH